MSVWVMTILKMVTKEQCGFKFITTKEKDMEVGYRSTAEGPAEEDMRETWRSRSGQGGPGGRAQSFLEKWGALSVVLRKLAPSDTRVYSIIKMCFDYTYICVYVICMWRPEKGRWFSFLDLGEMQMAVSYTQVLWKVSVFSEGRNHLYIPIHLKNTNRIWRKPFGLSIKYIILVNLVCQSHLSINKMKMRVKNRFS